jgi:hypothetical protein
MRLFYCLALLVLLSSVAEAQNQFGARLGITASTVTGDFATADAASTHFGFVGGLYLSFPLRYALTIQGELLYTQKGFETNEANIIDGDVVIPLSSVAFELTTLDVPLLLKYTASLTSDLDVAPYAGPYVSFELSERISAEAPGGPSSFDSEFFKSSDFGFVVGLDARLRLSDFAPTLGLRYTRSAVNLLEEDASQDPDATAYNSVVVLFFGLRL